MAAIADVCEDGARRWRGIGIERASVGLKGRNGCGIDADRHEPTPGHEMPDDRSEVIGVHRPRPLASAEHCLLRDVARDTVGPCYRDEVRNRARIDLAVGP